METKPTPSPWHIGETAHEFEAEGVWNVPVWANHAEPGDKIALEAKAKDREQARANARLAAAAPELLEACKAMLAYACRPEKEFALAAIAKAEGQVS